MKRLFLSAGHQVINGHGTGAVSPFGDEGLETLKLRDAIYDYILSTYGYRCTLDDPVSPLGEVITGILEEEDKDSVTFDIHFNSGPPQATGTEMIIPEKYSPEERCLGIALSTIIADTLGIKKRQGKLSNSGVKTEGETPHKRLGMLSGLIGTNVLMEVCFISNETDMMAYRSNFESLVEQIGDVLYKEIYIKNT